MVSTVKHVSVAEEIDEHITHASQCLFTILERRWYLFQNVGPVASPRSGHTMCTIKDRIFVLGGESEHTKSEDSALIFYLEICKFNHSVVDAYTFQSPTDSWM